MRGLYLRIICGLGLEMRKQKRMVKNKIKEESNCIKKKALGNQKERKS